MIWGVQEEDVDDHKTAFDGGIPKKSLGKVIVIGLLPLCMGINTCQNKVYSQLYVGTHEKTK